LGKYRSNEDIRCDPRAGKIPFMLIRNHVHILQSSYALH
jgi:hypothetical protein